jgi:hypothetical protein
VVGFVPSAGVDPRHNKRVAEQWWRSGTQLLQSGMAAILQKVTFRQLRRQNRLTELKLLKAAWLTRIREHIGSAAAGEANPRIASRNRHLGLRSQHDAASRMAASFKRLFVNQNREQPFAQFMGVIY